MAVGTTARSRAFTRTAALVAACVVLAGCSSTSDPPESKPSASPSGPAQVSFVVYGPPAVTSAYSKLAAEFTAAHPQTSVRVIPYDTHDEALAAVQKATSEGHPPDVFQISRQDLPGLTADKAVRRVDDLLSERQVDFGDGFSRTGLEAFSSDSALQCMPTDVSPLVVYYNTRLIDLSLAAEPGRRPVTQETGWNFDEFTRVAQLARRPGIRGLYLAPEVNQVAPFLFSGGGDLVDDPAKPTTLSLSSDKSLAALQQVLTVARDPDLSFDRAALRRHSAVERFKAGQLGMVLGYRDLLPVLREQQGLNFDVMPLPRISSSATDTEMKGLCISSKSDQVQQAADFITDVVSKQGATELASTGYVMPTNLDVLNSQAFLQRPERPLHSDVFEKEMRHSQPLPESTAWPAVRQAATRSLTQLFYEPLLPPLAPKLAAIDEASRFIFNPNATPSPSPSQSPSESPSGSPSESPSAGLSSESPSRQPSPGNPTSSSSP